MRCNEVHFFATPCIYCYNIKRNFQCLTSYPNSSTSRNSDQPGLRVHWNAARAPGSLDFWNPWSQDIPYVTFIPHLSILVDRTPPDFVNFASFQKSLIAAASGDISRSLVTDQEPIIIHVILGLSASVHNQSKLGFSSD